MDLQDTRSKEYNDEIAPFIEFDMDYMIGELNRICCLV